MGSKAESLIELDRLDLTPNFLIINYSIFEKILKNNNIVIPNKIKKEDLSKYKSLIENIEIPSGLIKKIADAFKQLGLNSRVIVRSCAKKESGMKHSFAGMLDSYADVKVQGAFKFIKKCWASSFNERTLAYIQQKKIPYNFTDVNVLIQKMLKPTIKGHIYSHLTEKGMLYLEYGKKGTTEENSCYMLNRWTGFPSTIKEYSSALLEKSSLVEKNLYSNADIEFIISSNHLSFVQARQLDSILPYRIIPFTFIPPAGTDKDLLRNIFSNVFKNFLNIQHGEPMFFNKNKIFYNTEILLKILRNDNLKRQKEHQLKIMQFFKEMQLKLSSQKISISGQDHLELFITKKILNDIVLHKGLYFLSQIKESYPSIYTEICNTPKSYTTDHFLNAWKLPKELDEKLSKALQKHQKQQTTLLKKVRASDLNKVYVCQRLAWLKDFLNVMDLKFPTKKPQGWKIKEIDENYALRDKIISVKNFEGTVKIVRSAKDFKKITTSKTPGPFVIVTRDIQPWFLPVILKSAGIVSEEGGITSHTALLCRELDIPFWAGERNILKKVRDGDFIKIIGQKISIKPFSGKTPH
ncbi:MAG: hypothetical protein KAJ18_07670 [Candidatus Omnitrophica bacterium]|nr:hypothetical protein [Candidatus Omnitrophota bacterium]